MKVILKILTCSIFFLCFLNTAGGHGSWKKETEKALSTISEETLHRELSFLTDELCEGRATGTRGGIEAAFWVQRKFEKAGLKCIGGSYGSHFTTPTGAVAHNVIGMIPGALSMPRNSYIIVGAHFDHLGELDGKLYPGADANASGTIALTSLADIFGAMKEMGKVYDCNILFVAFDAKEMDMAGSASLWKLIDYGMLKDPVSGESINKEKIRLMVNLDQIGSSLSPIRRDREDYLLMLGNDSLPKDKRMNLEVCNMMYGIGLDLCFSYYGSKAFTEVFYRLSDQRVFVDNGIPAVFFTSGITMNTNKTRDTAENLNFEVLHKRIRLIYHWLESMI